MPVSNECNLGAEWSESRQRQFFLSGQLRNSVTANPMNAGFYVTAAGYFYKPHGYVWERCQNSEEYALIYCCEGEAELLIGEEKIILSANHYLILPAQLRCKCLDKYATNWCICWFFFSGTLAGELHNRARQNNGKAARQFTLNGGFINFFLGLCRSFSAPKTQMELEGINFQLLNFVTSLVYRPYLEETLISASVIDEFTTFMEDNIDAKYGIKELAKHHGVSVSRYTAAFREKLAMSPIKYFNELKIGKACQFLEATDLSVKSISLKLGFDDPYYFSRVFTKIKGSSPTRYRELARTEVGIAPRHQVA